MSYILDALRKADAQRERDPARGIHAQPAAGVPAHAGRHAQPWWWGATALAVVGAVAAVAWLQRPAVPAPAPVPVTGFVKLQAPPPVVVPVATELSPPAPPPLPAPVQQAPAKTTVAATTLKAPPAEVDRILKVADLPASVQGELPKLAISGGVHSENPAQRMLIVGGQLKSEGAEVAPGLVLEQIRPRTAVLRFKGFRYSLPY